MMEWQPIETAPKDGSEFLACYARQGNCMVLVYWDRAHSPWISKGGFVSGFEYNATHWTPVVPPK
jgi:hypothetical protein